ncbi:MAG: type I DNA topoisomerase [Lachnospiraceae bacterium]|nr:type I DNA topoisomerase [Lachnospiraceae bacterium]
MAKNLVIVESPAKAKTIKKFLGANYEVIASNGHVRDLPKSKFGIDIEDNYEPKYITIRGKGELLAKLRKEAKKANKVYLATDPDREGEAISWHLMYALNLDESKTKRITFNEITKNTVKASLKNAREIDMNLVDSQQARRVLDRMVGYRISPLLWAKVKRGLSAGRVQSVALRMICDREQLIDAFVSEEYWTIDASFKGIDSKLKLDAKFYGKQKEKMELKNEASVDEIINNLKDAEFVVSEVKNSERQKKAPLPFTTSTLQQEASKLLNFPTQKTMRIAQQLYEGIDIKGHGTLGLITYLRTDSTRISEEADAACKDFIRESYGENHVAEDIKEKNSSKKIQDAHEAIRPSYVVMTPASIKDDLSRDQFRLYQLIWKRFVASRMKPAVYDTVSIKIDANGYRFTSTASKMKFEGFMSVYAMDDEKEEGKYVTKQPMAGDKLELTDITKDQHFTQPPAHYTEASLVKALEEQGIGRPSTYAPTITTILARRYVIKENKNIYVTELGEAVNGIMIKEFSSIVDVNFTANLEMLLDSVEEGTVNWKTVVSNFYPDLAEAVERAEENLEKIEIKDEVSDVQCEECGRMMVIKYGPHGKFLACPGFPECRNTRSYLEKIGVPCPKCNSEVVIRKTKKGRKYYGCENNPECDFMTWQKPSKEKCPQCGEVLLEKGNKLVCNNIQCGYAIPKPKED